MWLECSCTHWINYECVAPEWLKNWKLIYFSLLLASLGETFSVGCAGSWTEGLKFLWYNPSQQYSNLLYIAGLFFFPTSSFKQFKIKWRWPEIVCLLQDVWEEEITSSWIQQSLKTSLFVRNQFPLWAKVYLPLESTIFFLSLPVTSRLSFKVSKDEKSHGFKRNSRKELSSLGILPLWAET